MNNCFKLYVRLSSLRAFIRDNGDIAINYD